MEDNIIGQLSDNLKQNLMIEANKLILKDSPIFIQNFSEQVLHKTVELIKEQTCTP
jgi:hypothetical protein